MWKSFRFLLCMLCLSATAFAQDASEDIMIKGINATVDAYNRQDYADMQKPWCMIGRVVLTKKALRKEFGPFYTGYGKAQIDTITMSSASSYTARLIMKEKPAERVFLSFFFSDKGKIMGMGFADPPLIYPKVRENKMVSAEEAGEKIDSLVRKYRKDTAMAFNGCVMAIDSKGVLFKQCYGYADYSSRRPLNDSSLFDLASCTKQFTATAIMILADQGKLSYADDVRKFLPDLPYEGISIENLLTHTSGLPDHMELMKKHWDRSKIATNEDVLALLKTYKPKTYFKPGEYFMYSNTGYALLSLIIEKASGESYAAFLKENIFQPLGMRHSRVYNTRRSQGEVVDNYANGYIYSNALKRYTIPDSLAAYDYIRYMDGITGDDNVSASISDLALWDKSLREHSLVKAGTRERAFTSYKTNAGKEVNYGYGLFLHKEKGAEPLIYHTGWWPGYICVMMYFPEQQKSVIVLSNNSSEDFLKLADDIAVLLMY